MILKKLLLTEAVMSDLLWLILFFVAYLVVLRWLLPRLGVPT